MIGRSFNDERRGGAKRRTEPERRNGEATEETARTLEEERRQNKLRREISDRRKG